MTFKEIYAIGINSLRIVILARYVDFNLSLFGKPYCFKKKIPHFSNMIEIFPYLLNITELIPLTNYLGGENVF